MQSLRYFLSQLDLPLSLHDHNEEMLALPPGPWQDVHSVRGMNWGSESDLPQIKIWVDGSKSTLADEVLASSRSCQANRLGRRSTAMTRIWDRNSTNGLLRRQHRQEPSSSRTTTPMLVRPLVGVNRQQVSVDQLLGPGNCGNAKPGGGTGAIPDGRCGYGSRLPLLVISPYAKRNYADNRIPDPFSILRSMEDNCDLGRIGSGPVF